MDRINPTAAGREFRALRAANKRLQEENQNLKDEIHHLKRLIFDEGIPAHVREWMREFDLTVWEVFYCHQHKQWYVHLDSAFPYHFENCQCPGC